MQKEKAAQQAAKKHSASVFLARLVVSSDRVVAPRLSLSLSLPVRQRARDTAPFTHGARLRLLSLAARETPYGKSYTEKGNRRSAQSSSAAVRGGREIAREIHP